MKCSDTRRSVSRTPLILIAVIGFAMATGCGGGSSSSGGGMSIGDDNLFSDDCRVSDPDFPFCGKDFVGCRNQDETLYDLFNEVCPPGWTIVPEDVAWPDLACRNPEGETFQVDADECPPGWTEFTIDFLRAASGVRNN